VDDGFETLLTALVLGDPPIRAVFIRAPAIVETGRGVTVLASLPGYDKEVIVAARQGNLMATAFHPELTDDLRWHRYFLTFLQRTND
jgi:5'-phosphate synthase pdxT subunit